MTRSYSNPGTKPNESQPKLRDAILNVLRRKQSELTAAEVIQALRRSRYKFRAKDSMSTVSASLYSLTVRGEIKATGTSRKLYRMPNVTPSRNPDSIPLADDDSLLTFIVKRGGLSLGSDLAGEQRWYRQHARGARPGLFKKKAPLTWEEMWLEANDEGYGPFETDHELFEAIENECRGIRVYHKTADFNASPDSDEEETERHIKFTGCCPTCGSRLKESLDDYLGI